MKLPSSWCSIVAVLLGLAFPATPQVIPAPMKGEMPAVSFTSAPSLANLTVVSFSSSTVFDDNFSNSASAHQSGEQQYVSATFGLQQVRRRLRWNLGYRPGIVVGAGTWLGSQFNQVFGAAAELQPSVRWSLKLRQDYTLTTNPFEHLGEAPLQPALAPLEQPNDALVLPQLRRTASFSGAGLSYRLSRHTTAGLGGSYALQQYDDNYAGDSSTPLIDNRAAAGNGYISRQFSRRYTAGVEYRLLSLTFPGSDMRALTHSVLSFHQFALTPGSSLVVYAGPEYARTRGQAFVTRNAPAFSASWSPAAGAIYTWSAMRTTLQAGYSRRITDGGGLQGPVRLNAAWLRFGRQLQRRWTAEVRAELAQQTVLPETPGDRLRMLRAGFGLRRELGRNATLYFSYDRLYQTGASAGYRPGNHNRVMLSIEHSLMRPLGR